MMENRWTWQGFPETTPTTTRDRLFTPKFTETGDKKRRRRLRVATTSLLVTAEPLPPCSFYLSVSLLNDFHCFISETLLFAEGKKLKSQPWQHPFSCSTAFTRTCTHTQTMTQTYTRGGVSFLWLMRAGMMGVRHVMRFIELGSLFKFNQELWLLMKIWDRKSLW